MKKQVSIFLQMRRFRRRLKSKEKQKQNRIRRQQKRASKNYLKKLGSQITTLHDAYAELLPKNLRYLIGEPKSPFYIKKLSEFKFEPKKTLLVPNNFSIIDNAKESYGFLRDLVSVFYYQSCSEIEIEYKNCDQIDLLTQILLDSILQDISTFMDTVAILGIERIVNITQLGGKYFGKEKLKRMINSVGSPVVLLNRKVNYTNVLSYNLRCLDGLQSRNKVDAQQEYDATTLLQYVNKCLSRMNKQLTRDALRELGSMPLPSACISPASTTCVLSLSSSVRSTRWTLAERLYRSSSMS